MLSYYEIVLPLPTSVNASHTVGRNRNGGHIVRSSEYNKWVQFAAVAYRNQYPGGVPKFEGRLRVDYIFVWDDADKGRNSSDLSNREKTLSDFLEHKFFENDKQIDEQHHYRRIRATGKEGSHVLVRVYEIEDRRFNDPALIFYPIPARDSSAGT